MKHMEVQPCSWMGGNHNFVCLDLVKAEKGIAGAWSNFVSSWRESTAARFYLLKTLSNWQELGPVLLRKSFCKALIRTYSWKVLSIVVLPYQVIFPRELDLWERILPHADLETIQEITTVFFCQACMRFRENCYIRGAHALPPVPSQHQGQLGSE